MSGQCESMAHDEHAFPTASFVDASARSACRSLKSLSKQLMLLNASYGIGEFSTSGPVITRALRQVMESVQRMQDTLTEAGLEMNAEIGGRDVGPPPSSVVVSEKEYVFLNAVFSEYVANLACTSEDFSLFSRDTVDVFRFSPCLQVSGQTSNAS